jgi:hypothetical protein
MTRVLIFGSRSLGWKHLPVFRVVAEHAMTANAPPLAEWMEMAGVWRLAQFVQGPLTLLNGDGPPGKERGAIGADKLAVLACMEAWPETQRRMRWFPPEPKGGETWAQAAARRNREMVEAKPDRAYCIHTDLDASRGSSMTASLLKSAGLPFWYVRCSPAGAVLSVELR